MSEKRKPRVVADGPLPPPILEGLADHVELLDWQAALAGTEETVAGLYTYSHPVVDGAVMDRLPGLRIISNHGVGVDHISLADAAARGIRVGYTPHVLDRATADMAMALLLAAARRVAEGDRYARSPEFTVFDPGCMLGREVHSSVLGIIGMGAIGAQAARRARGFEMRVLYHNRRRREEVEGELGVEYASFDELLERSDYVMICCPLTEETRNLIDAAALMKMKRTATLINIARGAIVDTEALTHALIQGRIGAAALDVTEPEPLPRDHPLLKLDNVTVVPHLGSATVETRGAMAEMSIENLLRGLRGEDMIEEARA